MKLKKECIYLVILANMLLCFLIHCTSVKTKTNTESQTLTNTQSMTDAFIYMKNMMTSHANSLSNNRKASSQLGFMNFLHNYDVFPSKKAKKQKKEVLIGQNSLRAQRNQQEQETFKFKSVEGVPPQPPQTPDPNSVPQKFNNTVVFEKPLGVVIEDWWTIYSPDFINGQKNPALLLPNNEIATIAVNQNGYRLNSAFNCTDPGRPVNDTLFWFRLNDLDLYYSSTASDINVLGSLEWETVTDISETKENINGTDIYCLNTADSNDKAWKFCNYNRLTRFTWMCRIKTIIKIDDDRCSNGTNNNNTTITDVTVIQPEVIIPLPSAMCNQDWSYKTAGKDWECTCKEGFEQSPIDLPPKGEAMDSPVKPMFQYKEIDPNLNYDTIDEYMQRDQKLQIRLHDHRLGVYHYDFGKIVTLDGAVFKAQQISFHTPSNHRINGKQFPLEISIIHFGITKGDIAKQVILSFLFDKQPGVYNKFLDDINFFDLPNPVTKTRDLNNAIYIPKILYDYKGDNDDDIILMKPFSFYTYEGSLPFPPCTERTINYVTSEPLKVGSTVLNLLTESLRVPDMIQKGDNGNFDVIVSDWIPQSSRECQEINGRPIFHYDHTKFCPINPPKKNHKPLGHYEKMKKDVTNYFYVNGSKPSGIPGAFVVSPGEATGKGANISSN